MIQGEGQGQGFRVPDKLSARAVFGILGLGLVVVTTIASDHAVYVGPPTTFAQRLLAIPHAILFPFFSDRFMTNVAVATVSAVVFLVVGGVCWKLWDLFVREPWYVRNVVMRTEREERWVNFFRRHK